MLLQSLKTIFRNELFIKNRQIKKFASRNFTSTVLKENNDINIVKSPHAPLSYPELSIDQYIWRDVQFWKNKTAIVDGITDRSITYSKLRDKCRALAIRLRTSLNLERDDVIALCLPNSIEFPIVILAASEAELCTTTINPIYTASEIARQLIDSNAKVIFGGNFMSKTLNDAIEITKRPIKVVYVKTNESEDIPRNGINFQELTTVGNLDLTLLRDSERDVSKTAVLPYSSGTTGLSKGVMLSHMNIVSNCIQINTPYLSPTRQAIDDHQDILPCVLPFFHIYGLTVTLLGKMAHGVKIVTLPRFSPETFLNAQAKYQGNILFLVPPILLFLNNFEKVKNIHTQSIDFVLCGAAPFGKSDMEKFLNKAPKAKFVPAYGLTEASPVTHMVYPECKYRDSAGFPMPNTESKIVKVDDENCKALGPNEMGEILVRGPQIMKGYHNNEKATKETLTSDGWLRTGDIGYITETKECYIADRLKELIKVKGFQVPPAELEEVLRTHPDVLDSAVIGIPNASSGELPRAFIVSKNRNLTEAEIKNFVAEKVAEYKRLEGGVEFVEQIPKNASGKILRRELKKLFL